MEEERNREEEHWGPCGDEGHGYHKHKKSWQDPMGGISMGLMVVWLGVCFFLKYKGIIPADIWWAYLIVGFGGIWILSGLIKLLIPRWRKGLLGSFIPGIVLGSVGLFFILDSWEWWPFILVAVGAVIIISVLAQYLTRRRKKEEDEIIH